jgi:pyruvate dehydrogenase E1 component alpha subunit
MTRIRRLEEKAAELYGEMKIRGFLHLYIGEEAVATGLTEELSPENNLVATYREHGYALLRGVSADSIMAEMYGKLEGCSMGRGGSMHLFDKKTRLFGGNAIVGAGLPVAVGLALADKRLGNDRITCCVFGDGAVAEGEFHESMNLASLWDLPVLFVCENNLYAMGTALRFSHSVTDLSSKGSAYAVTSSDVDGMDVVAVQKAAAEAVKQVRKTGGPYFLECRTYRFRAHSMFDAELYRSKEEVEEWKERDPIKIFTQTTMDSGLINKEEIDEIENEVSGEVEDAVAFAESGTWEPEEDLIRFVYSERGEG